MNSNSALQIPDYICLGNQRYEWLENQSNSMIDKLSKRMRQNHTNLGLLAPIVEMIQQ